MPTLPAVPNGIKVIIRYFDNTTNHTIINKLHYTATPAPFAAADLTSLATAIYNTVNTDWVSTGAVNGSVFLEEVDTIDISTLSGAGGSHIASSAGGGGGNRGPAQACVNINWAIARRYRGGKPKTFLPGATGTTTDDGPSAAAITAAGVLAGHLSGSSGGTIVGATFGALTVTHLVNVSYYSGFTNYTKVSGREASRPTLRVAPVVDTITGGTAQTQWGTQRRRLKAS